MFLEETSWKITLYDNPYAYVLNNGNMRIGTDEWYIINDTACDYGEKFKIRENVYKIPLSFNACENSQYNCISGEWYVIYFVFQSKLFSSLEFSTLF